MPIYTRETELRFIEAKDIYRLGIILDENNCWIKLMEIIPKKINNHEYSTTEASPYFENMIALNGRKYNNDHIRLIEDAIKRPGESRLFSQILFDEWSTSGRKNERPTLGVLLQLLIKAELFRAADFVAEDLLNEVRPMRPEYGPGTKIDTSLPTEIFKNIEEMVFDSNYYPTTGTLNNNQNNSTDNNKDFYTKYHKVINKQINIEDRLIPKPPPRLHRLSRTNKEEISQKKIQQPQLIDEKANAYTKNNEIVNTSASVDDIPKLTTLMHLNNEFHNNHITEDGNKNTCIPTIANSLLNEYSGLSLCGSSLPILSILERSHIIINPEEIVSEVNKVNTCEEKLPMLSVLNMSDSGDKEMTHDQQGILPSIGSKNLVNDKYEENIELADVLMNRLGSHNNNHNQINVDEDDDDNSIPNLSIFDQGSSNNESSLTSVTGTSGGSSFDLSLNDYSSNSLDNIPSTSVSKQ